MKIGTLKGFKNGVATILIKYHINDVIDLKAFHNLRIEYINTLQEYQNFETSLTEV